jgi:hypothetical protein
VKVRQKEHLESSQARVIVRTRTASSRTYEESTHAVQGPCILPRRMENTTTEHRQQLTYYIELRARTGPCGSQSVHCFLECVTSQIRVPNMRHHDHHSLTPPWLCHRVVPLFRLCCLCSPFAFRCVTVPALLTQLLRYVTRYAMSRLYASSSCGKLSRMRSHALHRFSDPFSQHASSR